MKERREYLAIVFLIVTILVSVTSNTYATTGDENENSNNEGMPNEEGTVEWGTTPDNNEESNEEEEEPDPDPQTLTPTEKEDSTVTCPDGVKEVIDMKDCPELESAASSTPSELPSQCAEGTTPLECLNDMLGIETPPPQCEGLDDLQCLNKLLNQPPTETTEISG
jgi:hypothetical protein